ncbi:hypothetical protein BDW02DRAFT_574297 [Decorospora gaudefroyi]|uniref:Aminoglycoside phosphotransferase domain-containing protein n=1 Tax=Decorospora gaudefroyi TaxID=184978 RepID=A0A6A5JZC3_9PLEO|nr:hypothetical protein BDW02DRAFT_574297 [Decorospora gaudefroyi]
MSMESTRLYDVELSPVINLDDYDGTRRVAMPAMRDGESRGSDEESESEPLDMFDPQRIFTETGDFRHGGEKALAWKLRVLQLMSDLFPGMRKEPFVELLGEGSFNMVIGVTLEPEEDRRDSGMVRVSRFLHLAPKTRCLALRVPFDAGGGLTGRPVNDLQRDVANLSVVGSRLAVPVPKVVGYDFSERNALGRPYVLTTRLCGTALCHLWVKLNVAQQHSVVRQATQIAEKIASVCAPAAGYISLTNLYRPSSTIALDAFPIPTQEATKRPELGPTNPLPAPNQTPCECLLDMCERWIAYEQRTGETLHNEQIWAAIMSLIYALDRRGWLGDNFHLVHNDLFPRNMLGVIRSETEVDITGVIDWDMASFAPKVVALRAPFWGWLDSGDEQDELSALVEVRGFGPRAVRQAFLQTASEEYVAFGTGGEGVVARDLWKVVCGGMMRGGWRELGISVVKSWDQMHPSDELRMYIDKF